MPFEPEIPMLARTLVLAACAASLCPTAPLQAQLLPNLLVTGVPVVPNPLRGGQTFSAGLRVANTSLLFQAAASRTGLYLSTAPLPLAADILLGSWSTPAIPKNSNHFMSGTIRIPVGIKPGRYWMYVMADDRNQVLELNELDNVGHTNVVGHVIDGIAELRVSSIGGPTSITPGVGASIPITITNEGGIDAPSSATGIMLSKDSVISAGDTMAGWAATPVVPAGQSITIPWNLMAPLCDDFYRTGTTTIVGAIADLYENVPEHDETNNTRARSVTLVPKPPLGEHLEWRPTAEPSRPSTTSKMTLLLSVGTNSDLGVTAAQYPGYRYLLLWSGTPNLAIDAYTMLSLELVNSTLFPGWFGTIDARGHALAKFVAPKVSSSIRNLAIYTHHAYFTPTMQFAGFGPTPVEMVLYP